MLQSVKDGKLHQNVAKINSNNLPPEQEVLRALALLLNENKNEVSETVASLLTATAENKHFREKVSGRKSPITQGTSIIMIFFFSLCVSNAYIYKIIAPSLI